MDNQALEEQSVFSEQVIHISKQTLSRDEAIDQLIENLNEQGYITDQSQLKSDVLKRDGINDSDWNERSHSSCKIGCG